jgi:hypothetical protein
MTSDAGATEPHRHTAEEVLAALWVEAGSGLSEDEARSLRALRKQ